jgi:acetyl-CoA synthetase
VGFPHEIKGTGIYAYCAMKPGYEASDQEEIIGGLKQQVRQAIGALAIPDQIQLVRGLPKTRSGKIMRRILRQIAAGEYENLGDLTTLAEPAVVDELIRQHRERSGG